MVKKIVLLVLVVVSFVFGQDNKSKYFDENSFYSYSFRPLVGIDCGYAYLNTTSDNGDLHRSLYSYSIYVGIPFGDYEIIIKHKNSNKHDFDLVSNSLILNFAIDGSGTDKTYLGVIAGDGTLKWKAEKFSALNLSKREVEDRFYGVHIGQKYKFTRNFYVKIELEYMKYDFITKSNLSEVSIDNTTEFIYGIEYRF
jgi:hypothetical protein